MKWGWRRMPANWIFIVQVIFNVQIWWSIPFVGTHHSIQLGMIVSELRPATIYHAEPCIQDLIHGLQCLWWLICWIYIFLRISNALFMFALLNRVHIQYWIPAVQAKMDGRRKSCSKYFDSGQSLRAGNTEFSGGHASSTTPGKLNSYGC